MVDHAERAINGLQEEARKLEGESEMAVLGFDFGTTNSLVSLIRGDRPINLFGSDGLPIPSVACYEGNRKSSATEAKERLARAGLGVQENVVRSPKMLLGRDSVFVEGVEFSPVGVGVADVAGFVRDEAIKTARRGRRLNIEIEDRGRNDTDQHGWSAPGRR